MPSSTSSKSTTREDLLEASTQLILTKGFHGSRVEEICRAAGVTKGAFFHYFRSKRDLGQQVLLRYAERMSSMLDSGVDGEETDPLQRLYGHLDHVIQGTSRPEVTRGCLLGALTQEMSLEDQNLREICSVSFQRWEEKLRDLILEAMAAHPPAHPADAAQLARFFIGTIQGALVLSKAHDNSMVLTENLTHYRRYIQLLFEGAGPVLAE